MRRNPRTVVEESSGVKVLYKHPRSKFISWPPEWTERHYNGSSEPCDMLIGFCSCGAAHYEEEAWVQAALRHYNSEIRDYPQNPNEQVRLATLGTLDKPQEQYATSLSYF